MSEPSAHHPHNSAPVSFSSTETSFPPRVPLVHQLPALQADLKKVAAAGGTVHGRKVAILVRWEDDNTGADKDIITIGKVMETFGIHYAEYIVNTSDPTPGWNLQAKIREFMVDCHRSKLHSLFVFYYLGHGTIVDGDLDFVSGKKRISWSGIRSDFWDELDAMKYVDVLGILDCCYSSAAERVQYSRAIQIMAACGPNEHSSQPRSVIYYATILCSSALQQPVKCDHSRFVSRSPTTETTQCSNCCDGNS